jgi:hypothetical protein
MMEGFWVMLLDLWYNWLNPFEVNDFDRFANYPLIIDIPQFLPKPGDHYWSLDSRGVWQLTIQPDPISSDIIEEHSSSIHSKWGIFIPLSVIGGTVILGWLLSFSLNGL